MKETLCALATLAFTATMASAFPGGNDCRPVLTSNSNPSCPWIWHYSPRNDLVYVYKACVFERTGFPRSDDLGISTLYLQAVCEHDRNLIFNRD